MSVKLKPEQKLALPQIHNGCILCGGVGSGKSITALAYYHTHFGGKLEPTFQPIYDIRATGDPAAKAPDLYIITTARKRDDCEWESELAKFLMSTNPDKNLYSNKIAIDSWNNIKKYTGITHAFFIFDEQRVCGDGPWADAFVKIARANQWILLSATPGDHWADYAQVFIANGYYKNITEFNRQHVNYIYRPGMKFRQIDHKHYANTGKLLKIQRDILVKMDCTRPAELIYNTVSVDYDVRTYKDIMKNRWDPYKNEPITNASSLCYILRKVVNSDLSRQMKLLDIVEEHPKAIIFYSFDYELEILHKLFEGAGYPMAEWNGHKHEPVPTGDHWVYFAQYTSSCEGWNCITTDTIIFYSQSYSYKVMTQAAGRINRLNTPYKKLYYFTLKSTAPIDLGIARALEMKKDFNEGHFCSLYN